jgi:hypothetical protein
MVATIVNTKIIVPPTAVMARACLIMASANLSPEAKRSVSLNGNYVALVDHHVQWSWHSEHYVV